jgi:hypothetical protein
MLLFHYKNGYANAPQCYVIQTLHIFLDIHQQNAQITNKLQLAPYHSQTLHMFRLSMSHHQGLCKV